MAFTTAMLGISAASAAANAIGSATRSNGQQQGNYEYQEAAYNQSLANTRNQALIEALINQRSTAGQTDAFGSSMQYDPATNQWTSTLGQLPKDAQTAAMQASIERNTTDMRQQQLANQDAARRAAVAAPGADAAIRNVGSFRPMGQDQLIGLLQQQATNAQNATYRPLIQDTLRSMQRSGTAAGSSLDQIGRGAASNLRDSLIDAQIKGMTGTDQINQSRRQGLETSAANQSALANPNFQYTNISPSGVDNTMSQLMAQRAQGSAIAPAYGMGALNTATKDSTDAAKQAGGAVPDPNAGTNNLLSAGNQLATATGPGGAFTNLANQISKQNDPWNTTWNGDVSSYNPTYYSPTLQFGQPGVQDTSQFG